MKPIDPKTHPSWLQRYMPALRQDLHTTSEAIKASETTSELKPQMQALAEQVEVLGSIVHALVDHVARTR